MCTSKYIDIRYFVHVTQIFSISHWDSMYDPALMKIRLHVLVPYAAGKRTTWKYTICCNFKTKC